MGLLYLLTLYVTVLIQYPLREAVKGGMKEVVENRFPRNEFSVDNEGTHVQRIPAI